MLSKPVVSLLTIAVASAAASIARAQTVYNYDPAVAGEDRWDQSEKWGLESGYPTGVGTPPKSAGQPPTKP